MADGVFAMPTPKTNGSPPGHPDRKARMPWKGESKPVLQVRCILVLDVFIARVDASICAQAVYALSLALVMLFFEVFERPSVPACWRRPIVVGPLSLALSKDNDLHTAGAKTDIEHAAKCRVDLQKAACGARGR